MREKSNIIDEWLLQRLRDRGVQRLALGAWQHLEASTGICLNGNVGLYVFKLLAVIFSMQRGSTYKTISLRFVPYLRLHFLANCEVQNRRIGMARSDSERLKS